MSEEKKSQMLPEESHKTHGQRVVYQCEHYVVVQRNDYNDVQPDSCYWFRGISNDQQEQCKRASLHDARCFMDQWVKTCGKASEIAAEAGVRLEPHDEPSVPSTPKRF